MNSEYNYITIPREDYNCLIDSCVRLNIIRDIYMSGKNLYLEETILSILGLDNGDKEKQA